MAKHSNLVSLLIPTRKFPPLPTGEGDSYERIGKIGEEISKNAIRKARKKRLSKSRRP